MSRPKANPDGEPSPVLVERMGGLLLTVACLSWAATTNIEGLWKTVVVWAPPLLTIPITRLGRRSLDANPTLRHTERVTGIVHYAMIIALGCGLFPAFRTILASPVITYPVLRQVVWTGVVVTGFVTFLTVLNLAVRGLGAPFAVRLSTRLATDWMYARTRNPMLLSTLAWFVALAVWHQAVWALLFLSVSVAPGWLYFVKVYEERELEIRFGAAYREYRKRTAFLFPRFH